MQYNMAMAQPDHPPTSLVPVVGPQFCEPSVVVLNIKKEFSFSGGDFSVSGVDNNILLKVEGRAGRNSQRVLYDVAGFPIISMRRKAMSRSHRWNIYRGDSDDKKNLLFTVKKSISIFQRRNELDVFLASNPSEQCCDFKDKKGWFDRSYTFYLGDSNTVVALVSSQYELKNMLRRSFRVTVYPNVDYAFIVAIMVIIDDNLRRQN